MIPRSRHAIDAGVLAAADGWGARTVCIAVVDGHGLLAARGPLDATLRWASISKLLTAYAILVGVRRGVLGLDDAAGPPGATIRHLLAHASGWAFNAPQALAAPGRMRIYSNAGFDALGDALAAAAGRPFSVLLREWVLEPLGMMRTHLAGPPSSGLEGPATDLVAFARELLRPTLLAPDELAAATSVAFPGLRGVLPGVGRMDPCDWGLGFELRACKSPHWTGSRNSQSTFGHFGGSGTFLWVDPEVDLALVALTDREFGPWALDAWPAISDTVLAAAGVNAEPG